MVGIDVCISSHLNEEVAWTVDNGFELLGFELLVGHKQIL